MRILQLIGNLDASGAETVAVNLANGLHDRGHVVLVCTRTIGPLAERLRAPFRIVQKHATIDWKYIRDLCALVREHDIDIIHTHLFGNDVYGAVVAALTGRALITTIHGADAIRTAKRRYAYQVIGRMADRVVAVSGALYSQFEASRWATPKKMVLIPNGVALAGPGVRSERLRAELGLDASHLIVGAVGNIKRVKGYEVLIPAFAAVRAQIENTVLLIAGANEDDDYFRELNNLVLEYGLGNTVRFLGSRPDVPDVLKALDVYVVASHYEGTSLALLEALASEAPVVATNVGGNASVVKDGETGLLVPAADETALSDGICRILREPGLGRRLGCAGAALIRSTFELELMVERYETLCNEVISARGQVSRYGRRFLRAS
jgi:glycosyltransferase involved in cell wall biosynthesis